MSAVRTIVMNAQECRTLTATCMHNIIAWLTLCMFMQYQQSGVRSIELHTLHLNRVLVYLHLNRVLILESVIYELGKAPGYVTKSLCDILQLNYALECTTLFTLSQYIDIAQSGNQLCS